MSSDTPSNYCQSCGSWLPNHYLGCVVLAKANHYGDSQEIAQLRTELTAAKSALAAKEAELEACRRDAARYRWLCSKPEWMGWEHDFRPDEIDREVDKQMAIEAMKGGEHGQG